MSAVAPLAPTRPTPLERLRHLEELGPRRLTGTPTERRAQETIAAELGALGYRLDWRPFSWSQSIYASLMVHFGLATAAVGVGFAWPFVGAALHVLVVISYALESTRKGLLLRRLFPTIDSQNLLATKPARALRRKRLVLIAHSDAAYTGFLFDPRLVKLATKQPPPGLGYLKKQLGVATLAVTAVAALELVAALGVWSAPGWLRGLVSLPAVISFVLNLDVVLRNEVVPGAADNLSGCTACVELAHRLEGRLPEDVELVIVISGAEEAGTGGALRLAQEIVRKNEWSPTETMVLGLDTLANGALRVLGEGELVAVPVPASMLEAVEAVNRANPTLPQVTVYEVPSGATDAMPFLAHGFRAMSLTCIDPELGAPRHYHRPSDTWRNVDAQELNASIDYAEQLVLRLVG